MKTIGHLPVHPKADQTMTLPPPEALFTWTRRSLLLSCQYIAQPSGPSKLNFYSSLKIQWRHSSSHSSLATAQSNLATFCCAVNGWWTAIFSNTKLLSRFKHLQIVSTEWGRFRMCFILRHLITKKIKKGGQVGGGSKFLRCTLELVQTVHTQCSSFQPRIETKSFSS